jgi:hypothetical protein
MVPSNPFVFFFQAISLFTGSPESGLSNCQPSRWVSEPARLTSGRYGAEITATCRIQPRLGGDFGKLAEYELDQLKQRTTIHSGPVAGVHEGLPSQSLDLTAIGAGKEFSVEIRTDVHVGTDRVARFVSLSRSTRVKGTGYGEYLKAAGTRIVIERDPSGMAQGDLAVITVKGEISKPWYIPEGTLLSEARKRGPAEYDRGVIRLADEIANNY